MARSKRRQRRKRGARKSGPRPTPRDRLSQEERERERAIAEVARRAQEALSPDTPPARVATVLVEDFEDLPSPVGLARTLQERGSSERARAVASEAQRLAPGSVTALTIAAEVARILDGDLGRAAALLDEALDVYVDPDGVAELAEHLLEAELVLDALALVEDQLRDEPEDEEAQEVLAQALERIQRRAQAGETLEREERAALERFADRALLYRLRDAVGELVEQRPELQELVAVTVREWLEELGEAQEDEHLEGLQPGGSELPEGMLRLAIERAWLREAGEDEADELPEPEPEPDLDESQAPLALLATDPDTPPELGRAARGWLETCTYGLWQVSDPDPAPGVWLTDIVSGVRRYAAIPPEQLEQASRWSVLMGALVALDGIWRSTGTLVPIRPAEADWAAEFTREATTDMVRALTGKRVRGRAGRHRQPRPYGVLADQAGPAPPEVADLMSQVLGNLIPAIAGELWRQRAAGPTLTNTDGHRLRFITALVKVRSAPAAAERLATHQNFRRENDGELTWWGRELTVMERESALAELRSQLAGDGADQVDEPEETPRWLRGRLKPGDGALEVEVNSEERLASLLELLRELGLEPELARRSLIDPTQDMPRRQTGGAMPFGASQAAIDEWFAHWPDERVPALGHLTPRVAAGRERQRARLEALLREFEHDAHLLARQGKPAPDIQRLRAELGMERWWG